MEYLLHNTLTARFQQKKSGGGGDQGIAVKAQVAKGRVVELWSLFPLFCGGGGAGGGGKVEDLRETFMGLAQILVKAMGDVRYPQLLVS